MNLQPTSGQNTPKGSAVNDMEGADRPGRKSQSRNPKLARPEPKKPKTESRQRNGGKKNGAARIAPEMSKIRERRSETNPNQAK
jgi:hypothetical protein